MLLNTLNSSLIALWFVINTIITTQFKDVEKHHNFIEIGGYINIGVISIHILILILLFFFTINNNVWRGAKYVIIYKKKPIFTYNPRIWLYISLFLYICSLVVACLFSFYAPIQYSKWLLTVLSIISIVNFLVLLIFKINIAKLYKQSK